MGLRLLRHFAVALDLRCVLTIAAGLVVLPAATAAPQAPWPEESIRFFEAKIRPVFHNRCAQCHSASVRSGGLSISSREDVLQGGNRGEAISLQDPSGSLILQALRRSGDLKMPPEGPLDDAVIAAIQQWIEIGAPWPERLGPSSGEVDAGHWSFQTLTRPKVPMVANEGWIRSPVDRFVLARLEERGLAPSPDASPETLVRRLHLDLTGLLPTPDEIRAFLDDTPEGGYDRLVERLLSSPAYGERWGRHWLDLARYADSNGYNADAERQIWKYRDWVIDALNRDLAFDQFAIEQLAGDLLPGATVDQVVATGFHRNTLLNLEGGVDFEQYRTEAVVDRVDVTGLAFLGLSLGCARCHDHKYDPISQREFYEVFAFFNSIDELSGDFANGEGRARAFEPVLEFATPEQLARREAVQAQLKVMQAEDRQYRRALEANQPAWEAGLTSEERSKLPPGVQQILLVPADERPETRANIVRNAFLNLDIGVIERRKAIDAVKKLLPKVPSTLVMRELREPRPTHILRRGEFLHKGEQVSPSVPRVLPPINAESPDRLDFARWLVDEGNPLTPRVTVNRIWQRYFGRGIVSTENDFGTQGEMPSHPGLLDWLASEFVSQNWSLKSLHRLIVTSATYRQSSKHRVDLASADPTNRLLGRQNRLRVESEIVRDLALSASGLLDTEIGGPSVFPSQPPGVMIRKPWPESKGRARYRRGIYTHFWRTSPHPGLMVFDSPDALTTVTRRNRSNTPLQALTILNDTGFYEFAQGLGRRIVQDVPSGDVSMRAHHAFQVCLGRSPTPMELRALEGFAAIQLDEMQTSPDRGEEILSLDGRSGEDTAQVAAWTMAASVLLNLDEFITRE